MFLDLLILLGIVALAVLIIRKFAPGAISGEGKFKELGELKMPGGKTPKI